MPSPSDHHAANPHLRLSGSGLVLPPGRLCPALWSSEWGRFILHWQAQLTGSIWLFTKVTLLWWQQHFSHIWQQKAKTHQNLALQ